VETEKGKRWQKVKAWAERVTDALGNHIDPGIMDTVILLNLLGIHTVSSCEGHLDRELTPNVMFYDPGADDLEDQFIDMRDHSDPEYKRMLDECIRLNFKEVQRINPLLDEFYQDRLVPFTQRLILLPMYTGGGLLVCQGVGRSPDLSVSDPMELQHILKVNQSEMRAFTEFLSRKYFLDNQKGAPHLAGAPLR